MKNISDVKLSTITTAGKVNGSAITGDISANDVSCPLHLRLCSAITFLQVCRGAGPVGASAEARTCV